ncbi:hypothetical protein PIB30_092224 [Stylosanthes scabra]|uniref:Uncharacterized protein n=1 Tax=Stylosanthes scabra TaxID=79078 RepID=A0ABU6XSG0_9FABA|nr:hypothetical protein [Stylosanthes scabra]
MAGKSERNERIATKPRRPLLDQMRTQQRSHAYTSRRGRHAQKADLAQMRTHRKLPCLRISRVRSLRHGFTTVITGIRVLGPGDSGFLKSSFNPSCWIVDSNASQSRALGPGDSRFLKSSFSN